MEILKKRNLAAFCCQIQTSQKTLSKKKNFFQSIKTFFSEYSICSVKLLIFHDKKSVFIYRLTFQIIFKVIFIYNSQTCSLVCLLAAAAAAGDAGSGVFFPKLFVDFSKSLFFSLQNQK